MTPIPTLRSCLGALALGAALLPAAAAAPAGPALDPARALTQYGLDVWTIDDGLPQNVVNAVIQTRDGYLWIGTYDGLARFDGFRFTLFNTANARGLRNNGIRALCEDKDGTLWIGTNGGGVTRYRDGRFETVGAAQGLPDEMVRALAPDPAGGVWVGTNGGAVAHVAFDRVRVVQPRGEPIHALLPDSSRQLWVGSSGGLKRLGPDGTWHDSTPQGHVSGHVIEALREDRAGAIWIGTLGGLARIKDGQLRVFSERDGLPSSVVRDVYEDRAGRLWAATGGGLARLEGERFVALTARDGLPDEQLYALAGDSRGSLWIGSSGGLARLRDGKFTTFTAREGLPHDFVHSILEDGSGRVWAGTTRGLGRLDGARFVAAPELPGGRAPVVRALAEDGRGELWLGTYDAGVFRLRSGRFDHYGSRDGLAHDSVRSLIADRAGRVWAATVDGLSVFEAGAWRSFGTRDGLPTASLISLHQDREGAIWIGTDGGGLVRHSGGRFEVFTTRDGLASDVILTIAEDERGALWIGTNAGLTRRSGGRFASFTSREGLPSDSVSQIVADGEGRLWIGTRRGVSRVSLDAFDLALRSGPLAIETFDKADGMKTSECTIPAQAGVRARDGRLWFATSKGVAVLDPRRLRLDPLPPPLAIERVLADGEPLELGSELVVPPGTERLEFQYTAPTLLSTPRVRFRFQLEGFERGWVEAGNRRAAHYTHLPPGRYRFRVTACNADGVWNPEGVALGLELRPYFHQTRSFYGAVALGVVGLLFTAHRLRVRRHEARERQLTALVEERTRGLQREKERAENAGAEADRQRAIAEEADRLKTELLGIAAHDLKNPLQAVVGLAEFIAGDSPPVAEAARGIMRSSHRMLALIEDLLTTAALDGSEIRLDARPTDVAAAARSMADEYRARLERKSQTLSVSAPEAAAWALADETRLRQVLDNLLSNASKFSPEGALIRLEVRGGPERVACEVHDRGPGLSAGELERVFGKFVRLSARPTAGEPSTGLGLSIAKRLIELSGGRIWARSDGPGRGSSFGFELPRTDPP